MKINSYNPLAQDRTKCGLSFLNAPSRTKQEFRDEVNINTIIQRMLKAGRITPATAEPLYLDVSLHDDYHAMQNRIGSVKSIFERLPAADRAAFGNDPAVMLEWAANPENEAEAIELGILPDSGNSASLGVTVPTDTKNQQDPSGAPQSGESAEPSLKPTASDSEA